MGAGRCALASVVIAVVACGCGGGDKATVSTAPNSETSAPSGSSAPDTRVDYPSWCRPMIDDLLAAGLEPVDDGVGSGFAGQPDYMLDACYWSGGGLFVGRQASQGSLEYHKTSDGPLGPWKKLLGVGEQAIVSVPYGMVFWLRDGQEYAIGAGGDYCYRHKECRAQLAQAAQLVDARLAGS